MRFASKVWMIAIVAMMCLPAVAQQKINAVTGVNWVPITGAGTPTSRSIACTPTNYGQPYQNTAVTPNTFYTCGNDGWAIRMGGQGPVGPIGPPGPATVNPFYTAPALMLGDSTMAGVGCDIYQHCFAGVLTSSHAGQTFNNGLGGNGMEQAAVVTATNQNFNYLANLSLPLPVVVLDEGINNASGCGSSAGCQSTYSLAANAAVALAGMTDTQGNRTPFTCGSGWTNNTTPYRLPFESSTTNGNSCTATITTSGNPIGMEYVVDTSNAGTANCVVDSGSPVSISFFPPSVFVGGLTESVFRKEFPVAAGTHTLTCTVSSSTGSGNAVKLMSVDTFPNGQTANLPFIEFTNVISINGTNDAPSLIFSNLALSIGASFIAEGANLVSPDIRTPTNNTADFNYGQTGCPSNPSNQSGGLHPNTCGHVAIANAIINASKGAFVFNQGQLTGPYSSNGYFPPDSSTSMGWNANAQWNPTALSPGSIHIYPSVGIEWGSTGPYATGVEGTFEPLMRLQSGLTCYTAINENPPITSEAGIEYKKCVTAYADFEWSVNTTDSSIHFLPFHPWTTNHDNQIMGPTTSGSLSGLDINYIATLTAPIDINIPLCLTGPPGFLGLGLTNYVISIYRTGNDGNPVIFLPQGSDTLASGSNYVWTAHAGDSVTLVCSYSKVGGFNWQIFASTNNAASLAGTALPATITSAPGLVTLPASVTVGGGSSITTSSNIVQTTATSPGGTCAVPNGFVSVVVNGVTLHLATCP